MWTTIGTIVGVAGCSVLLNAFAMWIVLDGRVRATQAIVQIESAVGWFGTFLCAFFGWKYGTYHGWLWGVVAGIGCYLLILRGIQQVGSLGILFVLKPWAISREAARSVRAGNTSKSRCL